MYTVSSNVATFLVRLLMGLDGVVDGMLMLYKVVKYGDNICVVVCVLYVIDRLRIMLGNYVVLSSKIVFVGVGAEYLATVIVSVSMVIFGYIMVKVE